MSAAGTWVKITCTEREALIDELGRSYNGFSAESGIHVWAASTDVERYIFTEWGYRDEARGPVLRDERWPDGSRECAHYRFIAAPSSAEGTP